MIFASRIRAARTLGILAFLLLASADLAGCVTDQAAAANAAPTAIATNAVTAPIAPGQAVVTIKRSDSYQGSLVSVDVSANGAKIASIPNGAAFTGGVNPGPVALTVSIWSSPGQNTVHFNAQPGKRYAFEITPRGEQLGAVLIAGIAGAVADAALNGENSGAFKIVAVP